MEESESESGTSLSSSSLSLVPSSSSMGLEGSRTKYQEPVGVVMLNSTWHWRRLGHVGGVDGDVAGQ